ncbi:MAG: HD domain-containing protein, partial [Candidatus Bathyarchaeota archaeon]
LIVEEVKLMLKQMSKSKLDNLIKFLWMSGQLKRIPRSGWTEAGVDSPESVADHTFRTSIICMVFSDLEGLDELKMLRMALLHDLPEAITGDLTPSERTEETAKNEEESMQQLLSLLPETLKERYTKLWREYAEGKTEEAKAVRELEKLEMTLQAREYKKIQPTLEGLERFIESADRVITTPRVRSILSYILNSDH